MAISPQISSVSQITAEKNGLTFHLLSDPGNVVAKKFRLVFRLPPDLQAMYQEMGIDLKAANGDESHELPLAATYIIGQDGIVRAVHVDADYVRRMEPDDILASLRKIRSERDAR